MRFTLKMDQALGLLSLKVLEYGFVLMPRAPL
jgi:hypothetical protein